jgi:hypothetical protein
MRDLLWLLLLIVLIAWLFGHFVLHAGSIIHMLLVVVIIIILIKLIGGPGKIDF